MLLYAILITSHFNINVFSDNDRYNKDLILMPFSFQLFLYMFDVYLI